MGTLRDAFLEQLKDVYNAEKQITEALPKMVNAAQNEELADTFSHHLGETRSQIERLDRIFSDLGESAGSKKCKGMEGLLKEGEEILSQHSAGPVRDALLITAAQRVEHYEIAAYGTLVAWADALDLSDAEDLLGETLDEESDADEKLTSIAEGGLLEDGVNQEALATERR